MNCEELRSLLHGYVDGELGLERDLEIERHLEGCPACSSAVTRLQSLRQTLADAPLYHRAPAALRERIQSSLRRESRPRAVFPRLPWWPLGLAASLAFIALVAWGALRIAALPSAQEMVAQQVVSSHARSLLPGHLYDVESSNQHTVKPWFNGRVDFAPPVKDLDQGFPLKGGRIDVVDARNVAALVYERHGHIINLFVWPARPDTASPPRASTRQGYHVIHWTDADLTYWVVSDLNEAELWQFVELIRQ